MPEWRLMVMEMLLSCQLQLEWDFCTHWKSTFDHPLPPSRKERKEDRNLHIIIVGASRSITHFVVHLAHLSREGTILLLRSSTKLQSQHQKYFYRRRAWMSLYLVMTIWNLKTWWSLIIKFQIQSNNEFNDLCFSQKKLKLNNNQAKTQQTCT